MKSMCLVNEFVVKNANTCISVVKRAPICHSFAILLSFSGCQTHRIFTTGVAHTEYYVQVPY